MRKYFLIGFMTLLLIIPNQITAQSSDSTYYYDKTGQLDYLPFAIKHNLGLRTKYGRLLYRRITKDDFIGSYEIILTQENGEETILWGPKKGEFNSGTSGLIKNFILEEDYFSFIRISRGIEWIICEKQANGKWKESMRTYIEEQAGTEGLHRAVTILMPDKKTVTIHVNRMPYRRKRPSPTKDHYRLTAEKKILKNGATQNLRINKRMEQRKAYHIEKMKKIRAKEARNE